MKNHVHHYCSKTALCKSPACRPLRSCCLSWMRYPKRLSNFLMDPTNKLPHSFFAVNTVKTRFVYLHMTWLQSTMVLQDQESDRAKLWLRNEKCVCMETVSWETAWKSVLCEQFLHISLCRGKVSTKAPLSELAGFQISKRRQVLLARLARRSLSLAIQDYLLCGYVQSSAFETRPANIDDVKQRIRFPKEMLQRAATRFPSRLQGCTEWHSGHLYSVIFQKTWLTWII